jgi:hypothetical protein
MEITSYGPQLKKEVHKRITQASSTILSSLKTATCHLRLMVDAFPGRRSLLFWSLFVRINSVSQAAQVMFRFTVLAHFP